MNDLPFHNLSGIQGDESAEHHHEYGIKDEI